MRQSVGRLRSQDRLIPAFDPERIFVGIAMLVPRFSIRVLLLILTISAIAFLIVGMAFRGQSWAWGASIGIFCVVVTALVHAAWFGVIWLFAQITPGQSKE
jgi:hypothetical protein